MAPGAGFLRYTQKRKDSDAAFNVGGGKGALADLENRLARLQAVKRLDYWGY